MTEERRTEPSTGERWWQRTGRRLSSTGGRLLRHWQSELAALQDVDPLPTQPRPGRLIVRLDAPGPITIPARGYVFAFQLRATFAWSAEGRHEHVLGWYAQYFMPHAVQRLTQLAARYARDVAPHHPRQLEVELQRLLAKEAAWPFHRNGVTVRCRPQVRVELDERVRQILLRHSEELIRREYEYEVHLACLRYAERLSRQWVTVLKDVTDSAVADEAGKATREELAAALQSMMDDQRAAAQWIKDLLAGRSRGDHTGEGRAPLDIPRQGPAHESPGPADDG